MTLVMPPESGRLQPGILFSVANEIRLAVLMSMGPLAKCYQSAVSMCGHGGCQCCEMLSVVPLGVRRVAYAEPDRHPFEPKKYYGPGVPVRRIAKFEVSIGYRVPDDPIGGTPTVRTQQAESALYWLFSTYDALEAMFSGPQNVACQPLRSLGDMEFSCSGGCGLAKFKVEWSLEECSVYNVLDAPVFPGDGNCGCS